MLIICIHVRTICSHSKRWSCVCAFGNDRRTQSKCLFWTDLLAKNWNLTIADHIEKEGNQTRIIFFSGVDLLLSDPTWFNAYHVCALDSRHLCARATTGASTGCGQFDPQIGTRHQSKKRPDSVSEDGMRACVLVWSNWARVAGDHTILGFGCFLESENKTAINFLDRILWYLHPFLMSNACHQMRIDCFQLFSI